MTSEQIKAAQESFIMRIKHNAFKFGIPGRLTLGGRNVAARFLGFRNNDKVLGCFMLEDSPEVFYATINKFQPNFYAHAAPENKDSIYIKLMSAGTFDDEVFTFIVDQNEVMWAALEERLSPFRAEITIDGKAYTLSQKQLSVIKDIANGKMPLEILEKEIEGDNKS